MVECLTQDGGVAGSILTGVTALCPYARHINLCLVLVQPRKTCPNITEKVVDWDIKNQIKKSFFWSEIERFLSGIMSGMFSGIFLPTSLTLKALVMTVAADKFCDIFIFSEKLG